MKMHRENWKVCGHRQTPKKEGKNNGKNLRKIFPVFLLFFFFGWGSILTTIEIYSPSLGNIALIVSGFTGIGDSYIWWLRKECIKGEDIADLFGSSKDIQTESELTRPDFECESSNAWPNILATKLHLPKTSKPQIN